MRLVAPKLGLGSHYVSLSKELPVPVWLYSQLSSWHRTFLLNVARRNPRQRAVVEGGEAVIGLIGENVAIG